MDLQKRAISYLKNELNDEERAAFEEELTRSVELREELEKGRELLELLEAASEEATVRKANELIQIAIKRRASDIHILPGQPPCSDQAGNAQQESVVLLRIDGHLHEIHRFPSELHNSLVDRWKMMAECNLTERHVPQDGRISVRYEGNDYQLHNSFLPTITGERITARLVDRRNLILGLDQLGMSPAALDILNRLAERPYGFILTSGQIGAGKTTLLYSLLNSLNVTAPRRRNLMTVEYPVEYRLPGLSQTSVNTHTGLTFAAALRAIMRCDPDVVYLAQFRSQEITELATEMALTKSLVLGQVHVSSALLIPQRLRELGIVPHLIAQTLVGLVSQRLVRKICPECITEYQPKPEELQKAGLSLLEDGPFRHGAGCEACMHTGFKGRIGLFEVLEVDETLRKLIAENAPVETLWQATFGRTGGSLWDDARAKVRKGITTVEEVNWALFDYPVSPLSAHTNTGMLYEISDLA